MLSRTRHVHVIAAPIFIAVLLELSGDNEIAVIIDIAIDV